MDVELGFIHNHFTVMRLLRDVLAGIISTLRENYGAELALLAATVPEVPAEIPHVHFSQAQKLLHEQYGVDERGEPDLSPEGERRLTP